VPYTSFPNERLGLMNEEDYLNVSSLMKEAIENCSRPDELAWGACNILFPRCLLGFDLYPCRDACLGE